jgi:hypothetical protein
LVSLDINQEVSLNKNTTLIAQFEEGEPYPIDGDQPFINESIILYTSLFILTTVAIVGYIASEKRKKSEIR